MRNPLDQYPTPAWQTKALIYRVAIHGSIMEPCAGDGEIVKCFPLHFPIITNDIDPKYDCASAMDAAAPEFWGKFAPVDWTVTNPPFNLAIDILKLAFSHSLKGVALLLRLSFLEPTDDSKRHGSKLTGRSEFLSANPPNKLIVLPRWKYKKGSTGTDSCTTAWMIWTNQQGLGRPVEIVGKAEMVKRLQA